jgi:MraZ protein
MDPKGRLMLPPEFRDVVLARCAEGTLVLTSYDGCLMGFPLPDWEEFEERIMRLKAPSRAVRNFRRLVIGGAEQLTLDKQGRVRLSQDHRDYAGLDKDTLLVGQLQKFEIWNPERYQDELSSQDYDTVAEELAESGIDIPL